MSGANDLEWPINRTGKTLAQVLELAGWQHRRPSLVSRWIIEVWDETGRELGAMRPDEIWRELKLRGIIR